MLIFFHSVHIDKSWDFFLLRSFMFDQLQSWLGWVDLPWCLGHPLPPQTAARFKQWVVYLCLTCRGRSCPHLSLNQKGKYLFVFQSCYCFRRRHPESLFQAWLRYDPKICESYCHDHKALRFLECQALARNPQWTSNRHFASLALPNSVF